MPSEDELRDQLRAGAETIHIEGRGPAAAKARAQQRRRRQVGAVSMAAGLAVGAGFAGWGVWRSEPGTSIEIRQADDPVESAPGGIEFEWTPATDVLTFLHDVAVSSDGTFYMVSTAPGLRFEDVPPGDEFPAEAVYRSDDLVSWDAAELDGTWLADLDGADGLLYALGTTPATEGEEGAPRVSISADDGTTWEHTPLPTSAVVNEDQPLIASTALRLSASDDVVVALVATRLWPDLEVIAPGEDVYPEPVADGFQLYGWEPAPGDDCGVATDVGDAEATDTVPPTTVPATTAPMTSTTTEPDGELLPEATEAPVDPCGHSVPGRIVSWSEVGVSGPDDLSFSELFVSTDDGRTWIPADGSAFAGIFVGGMERTSEGFVAWGSRADAGIERSVLLRSVDGVSWSEVDLPVTSETWVSTVGMTGGGLVAVVTGPSGVDVLTSGDGGVTWVSNPLGDDASRRWVMSAEIGPLGIVVASSIDNGSSTELWFSPDGVSWSTVPLPDGVADEGGSVNWLAVGTDRLGISAFVRGDEPGQIVTRAWVATPVR